ncbi:uncharacterized protein BDW70DRAFT_13261 [Aspergillus foveolatus]|uniref:uncharacterized protein n=1 Tax=Aspergillus foveolatus TaxID=210207 RepID=UPI003CCDDC23
MICIRTRSGRTSEAELFGGRSGEALVEKPAVASLTRSPDHSRLTEHSALRTPWMDNVRNHVRRPHDPHRVQILTRRIHWARRAKARAAARRIGAVLILDGSEWIAWFPYLGAKNSVRPASDRSRLSLRRLVCLASKGTARTLRARGTCFLRQRWSNHEPRTGKDGFTRAHCRSWRVVIARDRLV